MSAAQRRAGNVDYVARAYNINPKTVRRWLSEGSISAHQVASKTLILFCDVEDFIRTIKAPRPWRTDPPFPSPTQEN
jgi:hypothetical protein